MLQRNRRSIKQNHFSWETNDEDLQLARRSTSDLVVCNEWSSTSELHLVQRLCRGLFKCPTKVNKSNFYLKEYWMLSKGDLSLSELTFVPHGWSKSFNAAWNEQFFCQEMSGKTSSSISHRVFWNVVNFQDRDTELGKLHFQSLLNQNPIWMKLGFCVDWL